MSSTKIKENENLDAKITIIRYDNIIELQSNNNNLLRLIGECLLTFHKKLFKLNEKGESMITVKKTPLYYTFNNSLFTYIGNLQKIIQFIKLHNVTYEIKNKNSIDLSSLTINESILSEFENKLRPGQKECLEAIIKNEFGIIEAPTGWGKSFLFGLICKLFPNSKIDIVMPRIDALLMLYNRLSNFLDEPIGIIYSKSVITDRRVTLISINSLEKTNFDDVRIVLADEVQNYGTDKRLTMFSKYKKARMYGFSANSKVRMDNAFPALESIFGPVIFKLNFSTALSQKSVVPIIIKWIPVFSGPSLSHTTKNFVRNKRLCIWNNEHRNLQIAELVNKLPTDEQIVIIVETIEHLANLFKLLPDFIPCYASIDKIRLKRKIDKNLIDKIEQAIKNIGGRKKLEELFRKGEIKRVIATKVWSESVDFPSLSILIRADGSSSPNLDVQIPGRVSRISQGKKAGIIYDFIDCFNKNFLRRSYKRYLNYGKMGWMQEGADYLQNYFKTRRHDQKFLCAKQFKPSNETNKENSE